MLKNRKILMFIVIIALLITSSFAVFATNGIFGKYTIEDFQRAGLAQEDVANLTDQQRLSVENRIAFEKEYEHELQRRKDNNEDCSYEAMKDFETELVKKYFDNDLKLSPDDPFYKDKMNSTKNQIVTVDNQKSSEVKTQIGKLKNQLRETYEKSQREKLSLQINELEKELK
jgi:hypothetical protein